MQGSAKNEPDQNNDKRGEQGTQKSGKNLANKISGGSNWSQKIFLKAFMVNALGVNGSDGIVTDIH